MATLKVLGTKASLMSRAPIQMHYNIYQFAMAGALFFTSSSGLRAGDIEAWNMYLVSGPVYNNIITWTEFQPRYVADEKFRVGQILLRQAFGVHLNNGTELLVGYHWQVNTQSRLITRREHRVFQQIGQHLLSTPEGIDLKGQFRLEQRMFIGEPTTIHRARAQLRLYIPTNGPGSFGPVIASETMYNLNSGNDRTRAGFEQQRSSVGLYIPLGGNLSVEATYLHQRIARVGTDRTIHVANIKIAYKLGSRKRRRHIQVAPNESDWLDGQSVDQ